MKYFTQILILFSIITLNCNAQNNSDIKRTWHWYFGEGAGIDFSSGAAVADTNGKMNRLEGCSAISDTDGNLLFYTDGLTVWNKNHQIMPNGFNLMATGTPRQSSIIVPKPGSDSLYYIFTIDGCEFGGVKGLRYSEVDMTLDNGLGDITTKNIFLFEPNAEILAAVKHANCEDIWVMAHERYNNCFRAYLVTSNGVDITPVINCIGDAGHYSPYGYMAKFSPDGSKLSTTVPAPLDSLQQLAGVYTVELYHFDNATGILSDRIVIPPTDTFSSLGSFSPDNSKLYIVSINIDTPEYVYQYNLSVWDSSSVALSKILITYTSEYNNYSDFQISPDNRIIVARYDLDSVAVINNPNATGLACDFISSGLSLNGKKGYVGLPIFIESYFDTITCFTDLEENNIEGLFSIYPNPFTKYTIVIIFYEGNIPDNLRIELFDILGKKHHIPKTVIVYNNYIKIQINRGNLVNGIYLLRLQIGNQIFTQKLLLIN
jgi:hypothetical protein